MSTVISFAAVDTTRNGYFYMQASGGTFPTPVTLTANQTTTAGDDFVLYLPLSLSPDVSEANVIFTSIESALKQSDFTTTSAPLPVYRVGQTLATVEGNTTMLTSSDTLLIPITSSLPAATVNLDALIVAMSSAVSSIPPTGSSSTTEASETTSGATGTGSALGTAPLSITSTGSPTTDLVLSRTSTSLTSSSSRITTGTSSPAVEDQKITTGALAGGIVGAFIIGAIACFLVALCFFRRRATRRAVNENPRLYESSREEEPSLEIVPSSKQGEHSNIGPGLGSIGWQKHLPQEKDDGTLGKAFRSILEQARIHMEGFYTANVPNTSPSSIETLVKIAGDGFPRLLLQVDDQVLILDGVLVRWMIHRVSGRSSVEESFLPREFAEFAKRSMWDMERDAQHNGATTQRKPGFLQAFSQWRQLTGFLTPEFKHDQALRKELDHKLEAGVQELDAAFAPWESAGKSSSGRKQSLRKILQDLSEAGYLLFTQPSVFTFDWTSQAQGQSRIVNITPAMVRVSDDSPGPSDSRVLVQPVQMSI